LFNRCVEGIAGDGVTVGLHVCFGNLRGRPQSARTYAPILPHLRDARCDIVFLEFANREMAEADLWARSGLPQALVRHVFYERPASDLPGARFPRDI